MKYKQESNDGGQRIDKNLVLTVEGYQIISDDGRRVLGTYDNIDEARRKLEWHRKLEESRRRKVKEMEDEHMRQQLYNRGRK